MHRNELKVKITSVENVRKMRKYTSMTLQATQVMQPEQIFTSDEQKAGHWLGLRNTHRLHG